MHLVRSKIDKVVCVSKKPFNLKVKLESGWPTSALIVIITQIKHKETKQRETAFRHKESSFCTATKKVQQTNEKLMHYNFVTKR